MYIRRGGKGDLRNIICRNVNTKRVTFLIQFEKNDLSLAKKERKIERRYRLFTRWQIYSYLAHTGQPILLQAKGI